MADPGDIWQRYDTKVMQVQAVEARLAAVERELVQTREERDHWARVCRDLGKKLSVARTLAERLRSAERVKAARPETVRFRRPAELDSLAQQLGGAGAPAALNAEYDRAREVLGLVLTALSKALDDDAAAELGRKLRHHAGGKLLQSITRGSLTLVPVDGRYLVDRSWLQQLDLGGLRRELDVAAQSGIYPMPEDSLAGLEAAADLDLDIDEEDEDGGVLPLPPPPPLSAGSFATLPPLLSALPIEEPEPPPLPASPLPSPPLPSPPLASPSPRAPQVDTVKTTAPKLAGPLIPNLIGRLIKNPGAT